MQKIKRYITFLISLALLTGCGNMSTTAEEKAIIWIAAAEESILFEVLENGVVKIISGNVILDTETKEIFCGERVKIKEITLTSTDASIIYELITKIGNGSEDIINPGNDSVEVFCLINNKTYWTRLPPLSDEISNENLLKITHILIKYTDWTTQGDGSDDTGVTTQGDGSDVLA